MNAFSFSPRTLGKGVVAGLATALLLASYILLIGPQLLLVLPVMLIFGYSLSLRRSPWAHVCLGYPLLFGLVSAVIGLLENPGYQWTSFFAVTLSIGIIGFLLVTSGFWKVLGKRLDQCAG